MEQRCTCGALLPPDARFCHKCGKPQNEADAELLAKLEAESAPPKPPPAITTEPATTPVKIGSFRAIGITMAVAAAAFIFSGLVGMVLPYAVPVVLCAGGFAAARFCSNRLSPLNGAMLGSLTGMWLFLVFAGCFAAGSTLVSTPEGAAMIKNLQPNTAADTIRLLQDPHQVTSALVVSFFLLVLWSAFGGLLAARLQRRSR